MSSTDSDELSEPPLSGAELLQLRKKAGRSLPVKKNKAFRPSGSWLEQRQIQASADEMYALLQEQRIEKQGSLPKAEWNPQFKTAEVTCRAGAQWNMMGHEKRGKLLLFPEEALFLLETNKLQVYFDGMPMSIQKAYAVLLGSHNGCSLYEYCVYARLAKQGYILLRHSKNRCVTRYERKIRLHQHTLGQKQSKGEPKGITNILVKDKDITNNNEMNKITEVVDIIEDISSTQCTDHGEPNFGAVQRLEKTGNLKLGDTEYPNPNTSAQRKQVLGSIRRDKEFSNSSTSTERRQVHENISRENVTDRSLNKEMHSRLLLTSQNDHESIEVEKSDYRKPSSNSVSPQSTSVNIAEKEKNFSRESFQNMIELMPVKEEKKNLVTERKKKGRVDLPSSVKTVNKSAKPNASKVAAAVLSHTNLSDIIILDEDVEPSVTRCWQLSESSSSEFGGVKCETPCLKVSSKRKFVDDEVETIADRKPAVSDLDSECEVLEISTSTKKLKESTSKETSENMIQRYTDSTPDMKSELKLNVANFQSNGLDWNQPSSSNVEVNNFGFVDDEVEAIADRKPAVSDLDSECEVLEISTSAKKLKESTSKETSENMIQKPTDSTPDMKSELKLDVANFQSNGLEWNQPSSSNVEVNNFGKHRITNVQLSDTEIEIVPGVIDKAQEKLRKQESSKDIEVIELEDDNDRNVKTLVLKKEEKMRILDSLPSTESKFLIHVKAPSQDLLPPNVVPQKEDYYIQLRRLNAAGIGGRPRTAESGEENNQGDIESHSGSRINPWMDSPPEHTWGMNVTSQNLGGAAFNMVHATVWQQLASLVPFMNNPIWNVNLYGMQLPWLQAQTNMWQPLRQNRGRSSWRRPYRGRARGRFRHQSTQISIQPVKDHVPSRNSEVNETSETIPLQLDNNMTVERNDHPESKLVVANIKPQNLNDLKENADLVILDDDDNNDDEPIALPSSESKSIRQREINKQKGKKRGASTSNRYFKPPKKLHGLMKRLFSGANAEQMVKQGDEDVQNAEADKVAERKSLKLGNMENWKDYKDTVSHVMQEVILDSSSSEEETEEEIDITSDPGPCENEFSPLVQSGDSISKDTVVQKLQIVSSPHVQEHNFCAFEKMQISFDVYLPNSSFRKARPGLPKYRIAVLGFQDHIPPLKELTKKMKQLQDDVPLVLAVVNPDSITFFQPAAIMLPVELMSADI